MLDSLIGEIHPFFGCSLLILIFRWATSRLLVSCHKFPGWDVLGGTYRTVVPAHSFRRVRWAGHTSRLGGSTSLLFILSPLPLCDYHCCLLRDYMRVWLWGRVETVRVPFQSIKQLMRVADSKINLLKTLVSLHCPNYIYPPSPVVCVWPILLYVRSHTFIPTPLPPPRPFLSPLFLLSPYSVYLSLPSLYRSWSRRRNFTSWWGLFIIVKRCIYLRRLNGCHYILQRHGSRRLESVGVNRKHALFVAFTLWSVRNGLYIHWKCYSAEDTFKIN